MFVIDIYAQQVKCIIFSEKKISKLSNLIRQNKNYWAWQFPKQHQLGQGKTHYCPLLSKQCLPWLSLSVDLEERESADKPGRVDSLPWQQSMVFCKFSLKSLMYLNILTINMKKGCVKLVWENSMNRGKFGGDHISL